jgi:hypothetical protein
VIAEHAKNGLKSAEIRKKFMPIYFSIPLAILLSILWGAIIYAIAIGTLGQERGEKFYKLVPLYIKPKYAIILYSLSGILYIIYSYSFWNEFHISKFDLGIISPMCVLTASQIIRFVAKWKKIELEESYKEEMKRKEEHKYDDLEF